MKQYDTDIICQSSLEEAQVQWGGTWTEQKLETFEKYVKAYLKIMNNNRDRYGWKLIYFDGFAGSGTRTPQEELDEVEKSNDLFGMDLLKPEDLQLYRGAAERVVSLEKSMRGFDEYYFVDIKEENCQKLKQKLEHYSSPEKKHFCQGEANEQIIKFSQRLNSDRKIKSLCFLDPFGMSINWDSIKSLAQYGIDLWILVPSGVIINRLLKKDGSLLNPQKLVSYFGISEQDIHDWFYKPASQPDFFEGEFQWYEKKDNPIQRISELFQERLHSIFKNVTPHPLIMTDDHNRPLFHFVFASNNDTAVKIAQDIINRQK